MRGRRGWSQSREKREGEGRRGEGEDVEAPARRNSQDGPSLPTATQQGTREGPPTVQRLVQGCEYEEVDAEGKPRAKTQRKCNSERGGMEVYEDCDCCWGRELDGELHTDDDVSS